MLGCQFSVLHISYICKIFSISCILSTWLRGSTPLWRLLISHSDMLRDLIGKAWVCFICLTLTCNILSTYQYIVLLNNICWASNSISRAYKFHSVKCLVTLSWYSLLCKFTWSNHPIFLPCDIKQRPSVCISLSLMFQLFHSQSFLEE